MPASPSPFPGMDPWLERVWTPIHHEYISVLRRQLAAQLPDDLYAQVETDVYVVDRGEIGRLLRPDVATFDQDRPGGPTDGSTAEPAGGVAVAESVRVPVRRHPVPLRHVAIREPESGHRLVTAIEVFSPTNKGSAAERATYRRQREAYLTASANVVEVDLLRGGGDLLDLALDDWPPTAGTTYAAAIRYADPLIGGEAEFYAMPLRARLPRIAVPLRPTDDRPVVDLQAPITEVYALGRYDLQIDYARPPVPPLPPADAAWAAERVAATRAAV